MKIYFLSAQPAQLTVNGCYFGITDTFERSAELSLKEKNYILFQPQGAGAIGFFLDESIRFSPPRGCAVYLLLDGIAIYARDFPPTDFSLRVIAQIQQDKTLATLYVQGAVQLSIQSEFGFFISTLPPAFANSTIEIVEQFIFVKAQEHLAIVNLKGEIVFQEQVIECTMKDGELRVRMPLFDGLGRHADCRFLLQDFQLKRTAYTLYQTHTISGDTNTLKIRDELLPFALFESVRVGADYDCFLSEGLRQKSKDLKAFLGEFTAVTITQNPFVCGLIREKSRDLYEVDYFTAEVKDGEIIDLKG